jgi:hypothetical protein
MWIDINIDIVFQVQQVWKVVMCQDSVHKIAFMCNY